MLAPEYDAECLCLRVSIESGPCARHAGNPCALIYTFASTHGVDGSLVAATHASSGEVTARIVEEGISRLHAIVSEEGFYVAGGETVRSSVNTNMEIVETNLLGILVACLVEFHHIRIGIARIFEVIVQTILSEEHHGIDERTHIFEAIIAVGVLALHLAYPSGSTATRRPALKELDAGIDVRTILVGAIDGHSRHMEHTVVPASEYVRIVPARVGVVVPVAGGITALELTDTDRNVHPEQTVVIDIGIDILRLIDENGTRTHV